MATAFSPAKPDPAVPPGVTPALAGIDVVVLAGGLGMRLRAVLPDRQKVVAEVGGRPFLEKLIAFYSAVGAKRIVLALGYRSGDVEASAASARIGTTEIVTSIEPEPRGTGGAVRHALPHLHTDTILVANGDSFAAVDLAALVRLHREKQSVATLALAYVDDVSRYGQVVVEDTGAISRFEEKPATQGSRPPEGGYINAGIYLLNRAIVAGLPNNRAISLEREVFPQLIGRGMYALVAHVPFIDIGTPESLTKAEQFFAAFEE